MDKILFKTHRLERKLIMKIKPRQTRIPYTQEEKEKLFKEGHVRQMAYMTKNKKKYSRKQKYKEF